MFTFFFFFKCHSVEGVGPSRGDLAGAAELCCSRSSSSFTSHMRPKLAKCTCWSVGCSVVLNWPLTFLELLGEGICRNTTKTSPGIWPTWNKYGSRWKIHQIARSSFQRRGFSLTSRTFGEVLANILSLQRCRIEYECYIIIRLITIIL